MYAFVLLLNMLNHNRKYIYFSSVLDFNCTVRFDFDLEMSSKATHISNPYIYKKRVE